MKHKGFTLIELMIVVAIIAIIAAIAIPNLLRSRMAANEVAAVVACKAYATAQNIYRRTDYNHDGVLEYSKALSGANSLYETTSGAGDIALIDRSFASAEGLPSGGSYNGWSGMGSAVSPKAGYTFVTLWGSYPLVGGTATFQSYDDGSGHRTLGFGIWALPNQYDGTGRNQFQISDAGTIYQQDLGNGSPGPQPQFDLTQAQWVVTE